MPDAGRVRISVMKGRRESRGFTTYKKLRVVGGGRSKNKKIACLLAAGQKKIRSAKKRGRLKERPRGKRRKHVLDFQSLERLSLALERLSTLDGGDDKKKSAGLEEKLLKKRTTEKKKSGVRDMTIWASFRF